MKKWLENYWYHYKWHTLIVLFFTVMLTVMGIQMCSRQESDIYIMYAGPAIIDDDRKKEMQDAFAQLMSTDYDKDGQKRVELMRLTLMNDEELKAAYDSGANPYYLNEQDIKNNRNTLSVQATAGDYIIYLIDDHESYSNLHNAQAFVTIEELKALGFPTIPGAIAYDDCSYYLNTLGFAKFFTCFEGLPSDTLVCVRRMTTAATVKGKRRTQAMYDRHLEYYKDLLTFEIPEGFEATSGE